MTTDANIRVQETLQPESRLVFLDALRVGIIMMVIIHHAAQAYGPTGGAWPVTDTAQSDWFRPFYAVNASVGLGLLFLLAGYLIPRSYDRKGAGRFLNERWKRLGVPLLVFALGVHLPALYLFLSQPPLAEFFALIWDSGLQIVYLHLWFLGLLLLFSVSYVAWRKARDTTRRPPRILPPPTHASIVVFVTILALATWIVRWWYPIDEWVPLLFVFAVEPANLLQYASLFAIGTVAYRNDWFRRIPRRVGEGGSAGHTTGIRWGAYFEVGASVDQRTHRVHLGVAGCGHQRRLHRLCWPVGVGAELQQHAANLAGRGR